VEAVVTELREGWIDAEVAADFPDLALSELSVPVGSGPSRPEVRERLRYLSRRMSGAEAVAFRTRPIPQAYRVLFRHLGLDPDEQRPPGEAVVVDRLIKGEYAAENLLDDAITVAVAETGVPVWAVDEAALDGPLGIRPARAGETMGTGQYANELPSGRLVIADAVAPVGVLFGLHAPSHRVTDATQASRLFSIRAPNVPAIHVEEALWIAAECLGVPPESG
jgi:DNA/RNA-binding domain of Phe-tRNA-synthetase-like protein